MQARIRTFPRNDPDSSTTDSRLALSYDLGTLTQGATTRLRYFIFFGTSPALTSGSFRSAASRRAFTSPE